MRMKLVFSLIGITILTSLPATSVAEKIAVGGSGSPIPLTRELAKALLAQHPGDEIEVLPSSIGEAGGLKATAEGRIQVGIIARKPEGEELQYGLKWKSFAVVPAVLAVHTSVPITNVTDAQFVDIYRGQITNWKQLGGPDARIVLLTRNEADMNKRAWRTMVTGFTNLVESTDAVMLSKAEQMLEALKNSTYAIGLTDTIGVAKGEGKIRALTLNGVAPTAENARSRRYPVLKDFVVVTKGEPKGLAQRFVDFISSAEGQRIIAESGSVPVK
jgi:phosphate transport system substrate-binding protein